MANQRRLASSGVEPANRLFRMEHAKEGIRDDIVSGQVEALRRQGWRLRLGRDDFLELVHLQAWYFEVRWFPRLRWTILDAPPGRFFIIADRAVVWGFAGLTGVPPSTLSHPDVQLFAPLTRSTALFAVDPSARLPEVYHTRGRQQDLGGGCPRLDCRTHPGDSRRSPLRRAPDVGGKRRSTFLGGAWQLRQVAWCPWPGRTRRWRFALMPSCRCFLSQHRGVQSLHGERQGAAPRRSPSADGRPAGRAGQRASGHA